MKTSVSPTIGKLMQQVMLALIPGTVVYAWVISPAIFINMALCLFTAVVIEALVLRCRGKYVRQSLSDNTALLTAFLFALTLPPLLPWWITVLGVSVCMLLGKHLYGGVGQNPFNPAMVGYAFLLISFPREMTAWIAPALFASESIPGLIESAQIIFGLHEIGGLGATAWDSMSMATPLDRIKHITSSASSAGISQALHGVFGAYAWEWVNLAWLSGGIWMLWRRIITWHIPLSMLAALASCYSVALLPDLFTSIFAGSASLETTSPATQPMLTPLYGLFSGAAMLGAFFIATDPVSAATSNRGRLVFGAGIGILTYFIREFGNYPEGIAFAVLLMNVAAPVIDYYSRSNPPDRESRT